MIDTTNASDRNARRRLWPAVVLFGALLAGLLSIQIASPWRFIHDDNGSWTQAVASARLRAGFDRTLGQDFFMRRADDALVPYLHHPPLYGTLAALVYRLTGDAGSLTTRAIPAGFHLLGFLGFAALGRLLWRRDRARVMVALGVYALVPMSAYFGKMPFNEAVGLCWLTWALVFLVRHRRGGSGSHLALSLLFWFLAGLTSWTAFVILAFHAVTEWVDAAADRVDREAAAQRDPPARRLAGPLLLATGVATGALVLLHLFAAGQWRTFGLFGAADHWGTHSLAIADVPARLAKAADLHRLYFANVPFLLYLVWIALRLREARGGWRAITYERRFLAAGSLGCLAWALLFLRPISFHAYGQFWYLPYESLAVGDVVVTLWRRGARRPGWRAVAATAALVVTIASTVHFLHYRYTTASSYAVRTSAETAGDYYTSPWEVRQGAGGVQGAE